MNMGLPPLPGFLPPPPVAPVARPASAPLPSPPLLASPRPWPAPPARRGASSPPPAEPGRWAESRRTGDAGARDAPVGPAAGHTDGSGRQSQQDGGGGDQTDTAPAAEVLLDPRVRHIGDAVAMVCRYEQAQIVWSARIPLDAELLPQTVLFVAYSPGYLELRFETACWDVRELLCLQMDALRSLVAERLSGACDVTIGW
ncbi:hypothetical protein GN316_15580 [Xylophilus sp. Kf1]|nr:hypothetical protein [Xylophilus sp. Kf1]